MIYHKFEPCDSLKPFVECYFIWEGDAENEFVVESPPNGFCSIVINYGDPYHLSNKKYERLQVPAQFIAGQSIYSYKLFLKGRIGIAGIVLKPAALSTFFHLESFEFTEERVELFQILSQDHVRQFADNVRKTTSVVERVKWMEEFLLSHSKRSKPEPDYIDTAANLIVEKNGLLHVHELVKESCMSRRTFERRFFRKVGLSPKYYARIRRIGYVCNLIAGKKKVNWPEVFYEAEYFDQAHFIKDFEEFTGRSPQQYLKENAELANFVEKPKMKPLDH